jgi:hypothetical protein
VTDHTESKSPEQRFGQHLRASSKIPTEPFPAQDLPSAALDGDERTPVPQAGIRLALPVWRL